MTANYLADAADALWTAQFRFAPLAPLVEQGLRHVGARRDVVWVRLLLQSLMLREANDPDNPGIHLDLPERRDATRVTLEHWEEAAQMAAQGGNLWLVTTLPWKSRTHVLERAAAVPPILVFWAGEYAGTLDAYRTMVEFVLQQGRVAFAALGLTAVARIEAALGQRAASEQTFTRARDLAGRVPISPFLRLQMAAFPLEHVFVRGKGYEQGLSMIEELVSESAVENRWVMGTMRAAAAATCAHLGRRNDALRWLELALPAIERGPGRGDERLPQRDAMGQVHAQRSDRRATDGGAPNQRWAVPTEVPRPFVPSRIEQLDELLRDRIDAGEVRAFAQVVLVTGEGQVAHCVHASVLLGNDVLDVKREEGIVVFVKTAVLTAAPSAAAHPLPRDEIDHAERASRARALACRMATMLAAMTQASYSARSSAERVPSLHFSASSRTRVCASSSARRLANSRAAFAERQRPTGSSRRSRIRVVAAVPSMARLYLETLPSPVATLGSLVHRGLRHAPPSAAPGAGPVGMREVDSRERRVETRHAAPSRLSTVDCELRSTGE